MFKKCQILIWVKAYVKEVITLEPGKNEHVSHLFTLLTNYQPQIIKYYF